jgi:hypothetical protein
MGLQDDPNTGLEKAAVTEIAMLQETDPEKRAKHKRQANLYFKAAMKADGNPDYKGPILE